MASHLVLAFSVITLTLVTARPDNLNRVKRATKCYEDLGCFSDKDKDFLHPTYRPINWLPEDREKIDTSFNLYTLRNVKEPYRIRAKEDNIRKSYFNPNSNTKVIIHGWIDNQFFGPWMRKMKDAFLLVEDDNVIIVDWSGGNGLPYTQATANTRLIGAELAFLLNKIHEVLKYDLGKVHILGHSLGAHVAGYAGERIKGLGRITGMDPAEPNFQNMPPSVRIDPTDADFVDVVHTDSQSILKLGLGMEQLVGHVDFFPNNGFKQPGCATNRFTDFVTEGLVEGFRSFVACNHQRAVDFVIESIGKSPCDFVSVACLDWDAYTQGRCMDCGLKGEKCAAMGINADKYKDVYKMAANSTKKQLKFFTKTDSKRPYCLFNYQISIKLENCNCKDGEGRLELKFLGSKDSATFQLDDNKNQKLHHGAMYTFLVTTGKDIGSIQSAVFSWKSSKFSILGKPTISVRSIRIVPLSVTDHSERQSAVRNFCQNPVQPIKSGESLLFNRQC